MTSYLDLVATAIGADIVPIVGENRILAYYGLKVIEIQIHAWISGLNSKYGARHLSISVNGFVNLHHELMQQDEWWYENYAVALLKEQNIQQAEITAKK